MLWLCSASFARAEEPPPVANAPAPAEACTAERFLILRSSPELDPALMAEVRTDLASELKRRHLAVCVPGSTARLPAVIVDVRTLDESVVIELDDHVTAKRVARDLSLTAIPANGRALAVAIAIDELLRASWAELTLQTRPLPSGSEPEAEAAEDGEQEPRYRETLTINARGARSSQGARLPLELGFALGYAHTSARFDAFSLAARAALYPLRLAWFELRASGLVSLPSESTYGDVMASGVGGSLTAGLCAPREDRRWAACGGARLGFDWLSFRGFHADEASASTKRASVLRAGGVALLAWRVAGRSWLFGELELGGVLRGAEASDGTRTILGVTGSWLAAQLGVGFEL